MRGRFLTRLSLLVIVALALGVSFAGSAASQTVRTPTTKNQCKDGGWRTLTDDTGQAFRNQGQCVDWANQHRATTQAFNVADLAGTFAGTQSFGGPGCSFIEQRFDATYAGSARVGTVTMHIDGCVTSIEEGEAYTYAGNFTLATTAGMVSGNATGLATFNTTRDLTYDLTLVVTAGTGAFASTTGQTLTATIVWPANEAAQSPTPITGTITVP